MALAEAGVQPLDERRLLGRDLDLLVCIGLFQRQPATGARAEICGVEDLLDGDRRDGDPFQAQERFQPVAAIGWMLERQSPDPLHRRRRGRLRMALVDRRQILQALEALGLKAPLPFVEAGAVETALPARLRDTPKLLGQIQDTQAMMRNLGGRITRPCGLP